MTGYKSHFLFPIVTTTVSLNVFQIPYTHLCKHSLLISNQEKDSLS